MACQTGTGTAQFCKYVQEESRRIKTATILAPQHIRHSQLYDVPPLQHPVLPKEHGLQDFIQNQSCGRTQNRRRPKHQREVPPSSSRPPPCQALPVVSIPKTSSASGDDETTPEKSRRRRKLCSMMRKYGRCTRTQCPKWHPMTDTTDTQRLDQQQATSSPQTTTTTVAKPKENQSKQSEHHQQQVIKKIIPAPMPKIQPQRKSPAGSGLMDQMTKITTPGWDDSEDSGEGEEDLLSFQDPNTNPREDEIKLATKGIDQSQPKQPEISPRFRRHRPSRAKGKRQQYFVAVAALDGDKPIPLEAACLGLQRVHLAGGRYRKK